jgi:hypothetical protein
LAGTIQKTVGLIIVKVDLPATASLCVDMAEKLLRILA